MTDILKRIEALLARAASPELEEARTSAWTAAKLIREHKVVLQLPNDLQRDQGSMPKSPFGANPFVDLVSDFVRVVAFGDCAQCHKRFLRKELSAEELCPKCLKEWLETRRTSRTTQHEAKWRKITARHAGLCTVCGIKTPSNTQVYHKKGTGIRHVKCHAVTIL